MLTRFPAAHGLYHVSSDPINKFELLSLVRDKLDVPVEIEPDDGFHCDRSLDSSRFRKQFDYKPPSWREMINEFATDYRESKS